MELNGKENMKNIKNEKKKNELIFKGEYKYGKI